MEAVLFDCDGVVLDSQKLWDQAVIKPWQTTFPTLSIANGARFRGRSEKDAWKEIIAEHGQSRAELAHWEHMEAVIEQLYGQAELVAGIRELLQAFQEKFYS